MRGRLTRTCRWLDTTPVSRIIARCTSDIAAREFVIFLPDCELTNICSRRNVASHAEGRDPRFLPHDR
jgi:hypothetical protein